MLHHDRAAYKKEIKGGDECMIYMIIGVLTMGVMIQWLGLIFVAVLIANEFQDE